MAGVLLLAILVPGVLAAVLMCVLTVDFAAFSEPQLFATHVTVFGMPLFIGLLTLVIVLHLGLFGVNYPDERREWWSRVGAWLVIAVSAWIGLFVISLYSPSFFQWLFSWTSGPDRWTNPKMWSTLSAWAATTAGGLMAGRSANTGKAAADNEPSNRWLNLLAKIAPIVFAVGLFAILSALLATIIDKTHSAFWVMFWAAVIAFVLSWRIDVDEFSMHHFYKNRLARCYLGASAGAARRANRFTGFDRNDDIRLACFSNWNEPGVARPCDKNERAYDGPYPILNTTLNLAYGEKLAWQQRKGASFIFTPRYCGFSRIDSDDVTDSYRPTAQYAKRGGLAIGTPLAVSGAAVSPNWGYHTSPTVAFLLTVFNVRLGWWLGNPSRDKWQRTAPGLGLLYLVTELLGFANNRRKYVYLSDGGHFDNMGLYELVRRRCRFIVVCDGEEDHAYTFGGIGSAIRQCRADFGVEIEIDFDALRPKDGKRSSAHCSIGKIYYPAVRKSAESQPPMSGTLVYLKATLTGDEPADVLEFAARAHEFPHQTTADQFFDESQFESYRRLGYHVGKRTFSPVATGQPNVLSAPTMFTPITDRETFFVRMRQHWYTSGAPDRRLFARHGDALDQLFERQRKDERLRFLDAQIYPEWRALQHAAGDGSGGAQLWIPKDEDTMREGFYFCNSLLQLMEDVYVDLDLEHEYDNPDNGGWMNLFRHWAWSGMFRVTWSISSPTYGARFANFCREKLELSRGQLHLGDAMNTLDAINDSSLSFLEQDRVRKAIDLALLDSFSVTPFEIHVLDPRSSKNELIFPVGFVLTEGRKLWYFRIQNHLRKMGLGRKALALAISQNRVDGIAEPLTTPEFSDPKVLKKPEVLEKPELLKKLKALQEPKALKLWPADRVRTLRALHESAQRLACEHNLLIEIIEA